MRTLKIVSITVFVSQSLIPQILLEIFYFTYIQYCLFLFLFSFYKNIITIFFSSSTMCIASACCNCCKGHQRFCGYISFQLWFPSWMQDTNEIKTCSVNRSFSLSITILILSYLLNLGRGSGATWILKSVWFWFWEPFVISLATCRRVSLRKALNFIEWEL